MSKDPLEELFGPMAEEPQPVPARQRLQQEQAERVRTAQLPAERSAPKPGKPPRQRGSGSPAKPWIIVGLIAVLAIVASIVVVNLVRGAQNGADSETAPQQTEQPAQTEEPTTPAETDAPATGDADADSDAEKPGDEVPKVEVGETLPPLDIPQWDVTAVLSSKFGSTSYSLENGNTELWLDSPLIQQLPCEGHWGAVQTAAGKYEVLKPAERCAAAPELYDELWGLTDAFVKSIK